MYFRIFDISNVSRDIGNKSEGDLLSVIAGIFILSLIIDFSPFTRGVAYISEYADPVRPAELLARSLGAGQSIYRLIKKS